MEPMSREDILKEAIKSKYGSVLKFSEAVKIPESSIRNIFTRGVDSVNAGTLVTICEDLQLDVESLVGGSLSVRPNQQKIQAWKEYSEGKSSKISDQDLMFALFGDSADVSAADLEDVKNYASYLAGRKKKGQ